MLLIDKRLDKADHMSLQALMLQPGYFTLWSSNLAENYITWLFYTMHDVSGSFRLTDN